MVKVTDEYLLKKYHIPSMGDYSQPGSELCSILHRLDTNKKLDEADKKWIRNKGMFTFHKFLENWENTGKPNFSEIIPYSSFHTQSARNRIIKHKRDSGKQIRNTSPSINTQKTDTKSKKISTYEKKIKRSPIDVSTDMRKPHMALHYKKVKLIEHIKSNLKQITPSNIPEDCSSLFLPKIWDTINESIKKDINELFRAYCLGLWTSTSLMAYRIFENVLKVHVEHDLKEESAIDITDAIKKLEKHKYDSNLIKVLYELKENRNSFMHGNTRASTQEAKESVVKVITLAMNIHNIKP